jgi:hypothetical protein
MNNMKRIGLLIIAIALVMPMVLWAQNPVTKVLPTKVDLGIKVGANFATLDGDVWKNGYKPGIVAGLFGGVSWKRFGVTGEALFSSVKYTGKGVEFYKGREALFNSAADSAKEGNFAVSYLNIPILLNIKIAGPVWFQVGPQYSGVLNINDKDNLVKDTKSIFKSGDVSGVLGLQANLPMGLRAGARYIIGLSDMNASSISSSWKTRTIQLHLGYSFL